MSANLAITVNSSDVIATNKAPENAPVNVTENKNSVKIENFQFKISGCPQKKDNLCEYRSSYQSG